MSKTKAKKLLGEYVKIVVDRGPMEKVHKVVLAHEVPMLRKRHGDSAVEVIGPAKDATTGRLIPKREVDANEEYSRLENLFGMNDNGRPLVEDVYGRRGSGYLRHAIRGGLRAIPTIDEASEDEEGDENEGEDTGSNDDGENGATLPATVEGIKAELDDMGIAYSDQMTHEDLSELLEAASQASSLNLDIPEDATLEDLQVLLEEEGA